MIDLESRRERLLALVVGKVGELGEVDDVSWAHGEALVLDIRTAQGTRVIAKSSLDPGKFERELEFYLHFAPLLVDHTPALLGWARELPALVLTRVPGMRADLPELSTDVASVHRRAGELLRRLHEVVPPTSVDDWGRYHRMRLEKWLARSRPGALTNEDVAACRALVDAIPAGNRPGVVTHCDWQPRNWIVDGDDVRAIDFEHMRRDCWHVDLQKLWWNEWRDRADLRRSFLEGYGRTLDDADWVDFRGAAAVHLATTTVWADLHGDAVYAETNRSALRLLLASS